MKKSENFSRRALKEAQKLSFRLNEEIFENRKKIDGLTIDGASSKDLDDALWVEKKEDGWILHISIADVSALVQPESYLDQEAFRKVFTRYFQGSNDPMLPHILSENSLSLLQNQKRPTLTFSVPIKDDFEIGEPTFSKTFLESQKRFTYEEVDEILKNEQNHPLQKQLQDLQKIAQNLSQKRKKKKKKKVKPASSHTIVEESMLLANEAIATYCKENDIPILFRNQSQKKNQSPSKQVLLSQEISSSEKTIQNLKERFFDVYNNFVLFCERNRLPLFGKDHILKVKNRVRNKIFFKVLDKNKNGTSDPQKAQYSPEPQGHDGLKMTAYTHGTSPIRRYADLINHRIFSVIAEQTEQEKTHLPYSKEQLQLIADRINASES